MLWSIVQFVVDKKQILCDLPSRMSSSYFFCFLQHIFVVAYSLRSRSPPNPNCQNVIAILVAYSRNQNNLVLWQETNNSNTLGMVVSWSSLVLIVHDNVQAKDLFTYYRIILLYIVGTPAVWAMELWSRACSRRAWWTCWLYSIVTCTYCKAISLSYGQFLG